MPDKSPFGFSASNLSPSRLPSPTWRFPYFHVFLRLCSPHYIPLSQSHLFLSFILFSLNPGQTETRANVSLEMRSCRRKKAISEQRCVHTREITPCPRLKLGGKTVKRMGWRVITCTRMWWSIGVAVRAGSNWRLLASLFGQCFPPLFLSLLPVLLFHSYPYSPLLPYILPLSHSES